MRNKTLSSEQLPKKFNWIRFLFIIFGISLPTIHFLVTYIYVNFDAFLMSFYTTTIDGEKIWGLQNYKRFFDEFTAISPVLPPAFLNTFKTFLISLIMFPIGIIINYFLYKKMPCSGICRTLFFLPMVISGVVTVEVYTKFISPQSIIGELFYKLTGEYDILSSFNYANYGVWGLMIWTGLPGNLILWGGTFSRIPDSLIESAKLDGVGWIGELFHIILPCVWPTFMITLIMLFAGIFGSSGNVFLLTEGKFNTDTFSNWMYMQVLGLADGSNGYNYMSAVGVMVTIVASIIALSVNRLSKLFEEVTY